MDTLYLDTLQNVGMANPKLSSYPCLWGQCCRLNSLTWDTGRPPRVKSLTQQEFQSDLHYSREPHEKKVNCSLMSKKSVFGLQRDVTTTDMPDRLKLGAASLG